MAAIAAYRLHGTYSIARPSSAAPAIQVAARSELRGVCVLAAQASAHGASCEKLCGADGLGRCGPAVCGERVTVVRFCAGPCRVGRTPALARTVSAGWARARESGCDGCGRCSKRTSCRRRQELSGPAGARGKRFQSACDAGRCGGVVGGFWGKRQFGRCTSCPKVALCVCECMTPILQYDMTFQPTSTCLELSRDAETSAANHLAPILDCEVYHLRWRARSARRWPALRDTLTLLRRRNTRMIYQAAPHIWLGLVASSKTMCKLFEERETQRKVRGITFKLEAGSSYGLEYTVKLRIIWPGGLVV